MSGTEQHKFFHQHIRTTASREELQRRWRDLSDAGLDAAANAIAEQLARMQ